MNAVGKIGVILPGMADASNTELLQGIYDQARKRGYDVLVFTNASASDAVAEQREYAAGAETIYALVSQAELDGVLFAAGQFQDAALAERILYRLKRCAVPCLLLEQQQTAFPFLLAPHRESVSRVTAHLLQIHACRKPCFVADGRNHAVAEAQYAGFCEAMGQAGLPVDPQSVCYAAAGQAMAAELAAKLATRQEARPDAVICAENQMALQLQEALAAHGVKAPGDILVAGCGGASPEGASGCAIPTIADREIQLGQAAVTRLLALMTGKSCSGGRVPLHLLCEIGSCGTQQTAAEAVSPAERIAAPQTDRMHDLSDVDSTEKLLPVLEQMEVPLSGWDRFDLCLCEEWANGFGNDMPEQRFDYTPQMLLALSRKQNQRKTGRVCFPTAELLPILEKTHKPYLTVFTPLHSGRQVFGYCAASYTDARSARFSQDYFAWCDALSGGLRLLRMQMQLEAMQQQLHQYTMLDLETGMYNRRGFLEAAPAFVRQTTASCVLVLLSWKHAPLPMVKETMSGSVLLANAIRLSRPAKAVMARIQEETFAVLLELPPKVSAGIQTEAWVRHLEHLAERMQEEEQPPELIFSCQALSKSETVSAALDEGLFQLQESIREALQQDTYYAEQLQQLRQEIQTSPHSDWNITSFSKALGVSGSYFQKLYKLQFHVSCMDDVINARLRKAKKLLKDSNLHIQEIAEQCGYQNACHFMRQFKGKVGLTASQYRKQVR